MIVVATETQEILNRLAAGFGRCRNSAF